MKNKLRTRSEQLVLGEKPKVYSHQNHPVIDKSLTEAILTYENLIEKLEAKILLHEDPLNPNELSSEERAHWERLGGIAFLKGLIKPKQFRRPDELSIYGLRCTVHFFSGYIKAAPQTSFDQNKTKH